MPNRIRDELEKKGWTQRQLSEASGVNVNQISRLVNGGGCTVKTASRLAAALDTTVDELFPVEAA